MRHPEKKPNGNWQVRFTDAHGRVRYKSFRTLREATGFATEAETARRGGTAVSADIGFDALCREYTAAHFASLRDSSQGAYAKDLARLQAHLGTRTLRSITPAIIEGFRTAELARIRARQQQRHAIALARAERRLAAAAEADRPDAQAQLDALKARGPVVEQSGVRAVNSAIGALRSLLKFAQGRGYVLANAAVHVKKLRQPPRADRPIDQAVLTPAELQRLIAAADPDWRAALGVLGYGGLRIGELLALAWGDVELDRGRVLVQRQIDTSSGAIREPKTAAGRRFVELPSFVIRELREWKLRCPKPPEGGLALCFPNSRGLAMDQWNFRSRVFLPALRRAKLRHVRIHDLRHGAASMLIATGADIASISRQLGHSTVAVTLGVYGHWFAKRADSGLGARLEAFLKQEAEAPEAAPENFGCVLVASDPQEGEGHSQVVDLVVGRVGIEPTTKRLRVSCSTS